MRFLLRIPLRCSYKTYYTYTHCQLGRAYSRMGYAVVFIHTGFGYFVMFPADVSQCFHAALHSHHSLPSANPPNALFTVSTNEHTIANNERVLYCYGYDVMGAIWHTEIWEHGKTVWQAANQATVVRESLHRLLVGEFSNRIYDQFTNAGHCVNSKAQVFFFFFYKRCGLQWMGFNFHTVLKLMVESFWEKGT